MPARSKLRSIPSSPLPSADEPKPDSFIAIAEVGSGSWMTHVHPHDALADPLPLVMLDTSSCPELEQWFPLADLESGALALAA
jgi:hypothetical protein